MWVAFTSAVFGVEESDRAGTGAGEGVQHKTRCIGYILISATHVLERLSEGNWKETRSLEGEGTTDVCVSTENFLQNTAPIRRLPFYSAGVQHRSTVQCRS